MVACFVVQVTTWKMEALFQAARIEAEENREKTMEIKHTPSLERSIEPNIFRKKKVINTVTQFPEEENLKLKDGKIIPVVTREGGLYTCLLCEGDDTVCDKAKAIILHIYQAHNERLYICDVCGKDFRKQNEFSLHLQNQCKAWVCDTCGKKYKSEKVFTDHRNIHMGIRPYVCPSCGKKYASRFILARHIKAHEENLKKLFDARRQLTEHVWTQSNQLVSAHNLEVHSTTPDSSTSFFCDLCGNVFIGKARMLKHQRLHTDQRPYLCEFCGATFKYPSHLQNHQRAMHLELHKCRCGKEFNQKRFLTQHIKSAHTRKGPFKCSICESTFMHPQTLRKHQRIHTGQKPFLCEVCAAAFNDQNSRNAHRFTHLDKKPYECVTCGVGFMQRVLLFQHMQSQGHLNDTIIVNTVMPTTDDDQIITQSADGEMEILKGDVVAEDDGVKDNNLAKHIKEEEMDTDTKTLMNLPQEQINEKTSHNLISDKTQIIQEPDGTSSMCKKSEP